VENELKAKEQQGDVVSISNIFIGNSPLRMHQIHQAVDVGILRPVWLEVPDELTPDMPRSSDLSKRIIEKKAEQLADEAKRADKAKSAEKAERAAESVKSAVKAEQSAATESVKARVAYDAKSAEKAESAKSAEAQSE